MIRRPNAIQDPLTGKIIVQVLPPPIRCFAVEGGGFRCVALSGFYKVMHQFGIMNDIEFMSGSSGGAMGVLAMGLGFDPEEFESVLLSLNMVHFLEGKHALFSTPGLWTKGKAAYSIFTSEKYSISSGNAFLEWLQTMVERKMGNKNATFADLEKRVKAGNKSYKYVYLTGTNLSYLLPECEYFSHETTPDMPLALAAYISACFPGAFALAEWKGCLYGDGGLVRNLPTKIFDDRKDDRKFFPPGYDFNDKGVNPGVLAVKIDTQDEIDQIIWGKKKKVDLGSACQALTSLYEALSQNTDIDEIREARMTIALPDNNIGSLEFTVDHAGKMGLISSAEKVTQNFLENYFNAAYSVKEYPNILAWLNSLSINELDDVIIAYVDMYKVMSAKNEEKLKLKKYINFLNHFFDYKRMLKRDPKAILDIKIPQQHINLPPIVDQRNGSANKVDMANKLQHIILKTEDVDKRLQSIESELMYFPEITPLTPLHHEFYFENIQALTTLTEYQRILFEEQKDLEMKLNIFVKEKSAYSQEKCMKYAKFMDILNPLLNSYSIPTELKSVLLSHFPIFKFESCSYSCGVIFMLNLHKELDRKIYVLAALLFLEQKKSQNSDVFPSLYRVLFGTEVLLPKNMQALALLLGLTGVELCMAAYRIEELIHYFEKIENPTLQPSIYLDNIFGVEHLQKPKIKDNSPYIVSSDVRMRHIIHSNSIFTHHYANGSPPNSLEVEKSSTLVEIKKNQ